MSLILRFFSTKDYGCLTNLGLLFLRVFTGFSFILYGWGKIQSPLSWMGPEAPVPGFLQFLAALSEFGGGIGLILGLLTRLSAFGITCTMLVAVSFHVFIQGDPFINPTGGVSYGPPATYFFIALLFLLAGPGGYSFDRKLFPK